MNRLFIRATLAVITAGVLFVAPLAAQEPVAPQPTPKSQAEIEALQAIFQAPDPQSRIKAADDFLLKFADTEFKSLALMIAAETYRQMNDYENMVIYGERTLEADPRNYMAMLLLAHGLAQRTREFDLDREEKLGRAEKYAKTAMEIVKTAPKPRPDLTDEQWTEAKGDFTAQGYEALGLAAMVRKNYDVAIAEFKNAIEASTAPDPATQVRLGAAYNSAGKYDDAVAVLDKVMAQPEIHPTIKQIAQAERARAIQAKGGAAPAAPQAAPAPQTAPPPEAAPAPAPAEEKKP